MFLLLVVVLTFWSFVLLGAVVSFVVSFVSSLTLGPGDEWAPCSAIKMDARLFDKKKITSREKFNPSDIVSFPALIEVIVNSR